MFLPVLHRRLIASQRPRLPAWNHKLDGIPSLLRARRLHHNGPSPRQPLQGVHAIVHRRPSGQSHVVHQELWALDRLPRQPINPGTHAQHLPVFNWISIGMDPTKNHIGLSVQSLNHQGQPPHPPSLSKPRVHELFSVIMRQTARGRNAEASPPWVKTSRTTVEWMGANSASVRRITVSSEGTMARVIWAMVCS